MSDSSDLGPMPEPEIEPAEPNPGGADAQPADDDVVPADLPVDKNPAVDETTTPSLAEGEDTSTAATEGDGSDREETAGSKHEPPA